MNNRTETVKTRNSSKNKFYDYYGEASLSKVSLQRFHSIKNCVLRTFESTTASAKTIEVADIGCGAGTQSMIWAEIGHHVHGLDVNEDLIKLAKKRAASSGFTIDYRTGLATELPWADESMDVCIALELLEHVVDWRICLDEMSRILRYGGVLALTTTNKLCPFQQEFKLPFYSWYPISLKRYFVRLALTTRQDLVNYAEHPAYHWFSFCSLRAALNVKGFRSMDRFDLVDLSKKSFIAKFIITAVRALPVFRWFAHVATEGTIVVAIKENSAVY